MINQEDVEQIMRTFRAFADNLNAENVKEGLPDAGGLLWDLNCALHAELNSWARNTEDRANKMRLVEEAMASDA